MMSKKSETDNVIGAFRLLREQLQAEKTRIRDRMVGAAHDDEFGDVRLLIEKAEGLDSIISQADALLVQFAKLFGDDPNRETSQTLPKPSVASAPFGSIRLALKNNHCDAHALYTSDGSVVVLSGSTLARSERQSLSDIYRTRRRDLQGLGKLTRGPTGQRLILKTDCSFNSPSGAACFVLGYSANGRLVWTVEGTSESLGERLSARKV